MYYLVLSNGEVLRPDTKETAMWAQGARAGAGYIDGLAQQQPVPEPEPEPVTKYTREEVEEALRASSSVYRWTATGAKFQVLFRPPPLRRRQVMDALRVLDQD